MNIINPSIPNTLMELNGRLIKVAVVPIGVLNMNGVTFVNVPTPGGVAITHILRASVMIISNLQDEVFADGWGLDNTTIVNSISVIDIQAANMVVTWNNLGVFKTDARFSGVVSNRGFVTLFYF